MYGHYMEGRCALLRLRFSLTNTGFFFEGGILLPCMLKPRFLTHYTLLTYFSKLLKMRFLMQYIFLPIF